MVLLLVDRALADAGSRRAPAHYSHHGTHLVDGWGVAVAGVHHVQRTLLLRGVVLVRCRPYIFRRQARLQLGCVGRLGGRGGLGSRRGLGNQRFGGLLNSRLGRYRLFALRILPNSERLPLDRRCRLGRCLGAVPNGLLGLALRHGLGSLVGLALDILCGDGCWGLRRLLHGSSGGVARTRHGRGQLARDLLRDLHRPQDLRRALAIATLNALAETLWQKEGLPAGVSARVGDAFDALQLQPWHKVVLVGAFPPYLRQLRQRGQDFKVLELDPTTLRPEEMPYYVPAHRAGEVVPHADVFITTGTTLVNDSLDALLQGLKPGAEAAVVGPTATLLAQPYARRGVTVLGGTRVRDPDTLLDLLAEGGSGLHFFGKSVDRVTLRLETAA